MNIILMNDFAHVNGGAGKIALGSAVALAEMGHRVTLFSAVGPVDPVFLQIKGLDVVCLDQPEILTNPNKVGAALQGIWNRQAEHSMQTLLSGLSPAETVVHVHSWTKALSASPIRAAIELKFKVIVTLHEYFLACPEGTFFNHPTQSICHLKPMSTACISCNCDARSYGHKLFRVARQWVQKHVGSLPSGVKDYISISELSEQVIRPYLPVEARISRVRNFIDAELMEPVDVSKNRLFAYSGRLSAEKGAALLAECANRLNIETLYIGDGPLREEIESLAPTAEFTGWLPVQQATAQLRRAKALVLPSLWYETQGLVVAEALAMGIPVIVPDTCAAREWVEDGVTGLWFKGGDAQSLEEKLARLRDDTAFAAALGAEAYRRYWQHPATLDAHCNELLATYGSVLRNTDGVPADGTQFLASKDVV